MSSRRKSSRASNSRNKSPFDSIGIAIVLTTVISISALFYFVGIETFFEKDKSSAEVPLTKNLLIKESADDPSSSKVKRNLNSNIKTLIGNYTIYLDEINNEKAFSEKGKSKFALRLEEAQKMQMDKQNKKKK